MLLVVWVIMMVVLVMVVMMGGSYAAGDFDLDVSTRNQLRRGRTVNFVEQVKHTGRNVEECHY